MKNGNNGQVTRVLAPANIRRELAFVARRDLADVPEYRLCEYMGMMGFSDRAIVKHLGWSKSYIHVRLRKAGIKRRHYRDMENPVSRQIVDRLDEVAQRKMVADLEKLLLK